MNWGIDGHKRQLDFLEKMVRDEKLAHGFLFSGPDGVGKRTIARKLASALGSKFPDYIEIDGREGIKIEQIRELVYKLSLKPYASKYKVAVIDSAEQMSVEAANALLKSLEEPKSHTIIILITNNPSRLPQTIISRTQHITFGMVAGRESAPQENDRYEVFVGSDLADRLVLVSDLADTETQEIKNTLDSWLVRLTTHLRDNPSMALKQKIDQVVQAQKNLDANANSKLLLTNLMLNTQTK